MKNSATSVVFYGASGHAIAIRDVADQGLHPPIKIVAYIDDLRGDQGLNIAGVPIIEFETWRTRYHDIPCILSIGEPSQRRRLASRVAEAGGRTLSLLPRAWRKNSPNFEIGDGSMIADQSFIGAGTRIGKFVQIMPLASIGHNCVLGDFSTVCPSAVISGYVAVEEDVFIGANATIVNGTADHPLTIGRGARIHAGAVVTHSVAQGARMAGNPARTVRELAAGRRREKGLPDHQNPRPSN